MTAPARLEIDVDQLGRFYDALFCYAEDGTYVSLRVFDEDRAATTPIKVRGCRIVNGCRDAIVQDIGSAASFAANHPHRAVFAPPVVLLNNPKTAGEKDVAAGVALSVELDQKPTEARRFLEALLGPATMTVASGGSWTDPTTGEIQDRLHTHWRLNEPTASAEDHARLKDARRLAQQLVGADGSAVPLVHPLRWPGSWHRKAEPKLTQIVAEHPEAEIDLDEALELLNEAWGSRKGDQPPPNGADNDREAECEPDVLHRLAEVIPNPNLERHVWNTYGMAFWAASGGSEDGLAAFRIFSAKSKKHGSKSDDGAAARWEGISKSPPTRIGLTFLINAARRIDPSFPDPRAKNAAAAAAPSQGDARYDFSHDGLALGMGRQWQNEARHVALWSRWLYWNGSRWEPDEKLLHMTRTRDYLRGRADSLVRDAHAGKLDSWAGADRDKAIAIAESIAKQLRTAPMVTHVVGLARSNVELVATAAQWDRDPWLLGTPGGTLDLRTGALRPARPEDFTTKCTTVEPAPAGTRAPIWQAFLERIFRHDPELIPFVQRALGYSLTGLTQEHVLLFAWGQGGNGKGVLLNTVSRLLGAYAAVAPSDLLLVTHSDRHPCDMAMLRGARLVTAQEIAPGRSWDEPKLKSLTGGDPITARFIRRDFFTYEPAFTLWCAGNHKPAFKGVDEAIRRRVLLLPFLQVIPEAERDPQLSEKLRAEWPAILRWIVDGCLAWQQDGLAPPASARVATQVYLDSEDLLGQWLADRCVISARAWTAQKTLYASWSIWAEERGHQPGTSTALGKRLDERGFSRHRMAPGPGFQGIAIGAVVENAENAEPVHGERIGDSLGARPHAPEYVNHVADQHFQHSQHEAGKGSSASVPSMITEAMKAELRRRGWTDRGIASLKPAEARNILGGRAGEMP